ncbi:MAG: amidohydrolase, partial [Candidatus Dadabacteria bacterium]
MREDRWFDPCGPGGRVRSLLIRCADVPGCGLRDVRAQGDRIAEVAPAIGSKPGEPVIEARGRALIPGLHDHHVHLRALDVSLDSVWCGPPQVRDEGALAAALAKAPEVGGWVRGIGYHESVAGDLDRDCLDRLCPDRPVRIQHRSAMLWVVNSKGARLLGLDSASDLPGKATRQDDRGVPAAAAPLPLIERDARGRATGRLWRADAWLKERLGPTRPTNWGRLGTMLAALGITGVTDATARNDLADLEEIERAVASGALLQRIHMMGRAALSNCAAGRVTVGPVKLVLDEAAPPAFEELQAAIARAHEAGRPVALHCVTMATLALALSAIEQAGACRGDRIEHASVASPAALETLAKLGLAVVTQPNFVRERGDEYLREVPAAERGWLYRGRSFLTAGIALAAGTDAPLGRPDPWAAMQAATDRKTLSGAALGPDEALSPEEALALFTGSATNPGGSPRRVAPGEPADL